MNQQLSAIMQKTYITISSSREQILIFGTFIVLLLFLGLTLQATIKEGNFPNIFQNVQNKTAVKQTPNTIAVMTKTTKTGINKKTPTPNSVVKTNTIAKVTLSLTPTPTTAVTVTKPQPTIVTSQKKTGVIQAETASNQQTITPTPISTTSPSNSSAQLTDVMNLLPISNPTKSSFSTSSQQILQGFGL